MDHARKYGDVPWKDPIIEEVRAAREQLFADCGYDLEKLVKRLRKQQETSGREVVTLSPKRSPKSDEAS